MPSARYSQGIAVAPEIIGVSAHAQMMRSFALRASPIDATILLEGETGVGKDHLAESIHYLGKPSRPYVAVPCGNIQETIFESELFGHSKGAYTDAHANKPGMIELAEHGTLFVDEIGDLTPALQVKFLRVLDRKDVWALGATRPIEVHARIIAATNKDLANEVQSGRFRQDLFGRLNVLRLKIEPLRERREDISHLVNHFLHQHNQIKELLPETLATLVEYDWPENVREVKNVIEKILFDLPHNQSTIRPCDVEHYLTGGIVAKLSSTRDNADNERIKLMLNQMLVKGDSFWTAVREPFIKRDIARSDVKMVIAEGLRLAHGSFRNLVKRFNMPASDYKRFLGFLRKNRCQVPFQEFRD